MGRAASVIEGGLATQRAIREEDTGSIWDRGRHGDDACFCTPFCASLRRAFVARRLGAACACLLCGDRAAATDPRRGCWRRGTSPPTLGARRAPIFPSF